MGQNVTCFVDWQSTLLKNTRFFELNFYVWSSILLWVCMSCSPLGKGANRKKSVQTMKFVLKQYDTALLSFDLRSEGLGGFACTLLEKEERHRRLFPLGLQLTLREMLDWLKSRIISCNREFVDKIFSVYGLDHNSIHSIVKLCMGLSSVNDSYWIVPEGFKGKFADYNRFENGFDKALSLVAWTGFGSACSSAFSSSPAFTTDESLYRPRDRKNRLKF